MSDVPNHSKPVVGILYPGEMGAALGRLWKADGFRVLTTLAGRSAASVRRAQDAGLEVLDSLAGVARVAHVIVSLVPPAQACSVAEQFRAARTGAAPAPIYVDANSIAPESARRIAALLHEADIPFVDGALVGLADQLRQRGILFLSGAAAERVAHQLAGSLRIQVVGKEVGQASALKSLQAGMSKGLIAIFLELSRYARELGLSEAMVDHYREFYPAIMELIDRLLPTYPRHARRRAQELAELEGALRAAGLEPRMVRGASQVIHALAELKLDQQARAWTIAEIIEAIHEQDSARETAER